MKVKINEWHAVATWRWNIDNADNCAICQYEYELPCPKCKTPGDECPPIQGECNHFFHMHCILKWADD